MEAGGGDVEAGGGDVVAGGGDVEAEHSAGEEEAYPRRATNPRRATYPRRWIDVDGFARGKLILFYFIMYINRNYKFY